MRVAERGVLIVIQSLIITIKAFVKRYICTKCEVYFLFGLHEAEHGPIIVNISLQRRSKRTDFCKRIYKKSIEMISLKRIRYFFSYCWGARTEPCVTKPEIVGAPWTVTGWLVFPLRHGRLHRTSRRFNNLQHK